MPELFQAEDCLQRMMKISIKGKFVLFSLIKIIRDADSGDLINNL